MKSSLIVCMTLAGAPVWLFQLASPTSQENPSAQTALNLAGLYDCAGTLPDGSAYRGTVDIVRHADTYQLLWSVPPDAHYFGIGVATKDTLAVSYFGGPPGVVLYRIAEGHKGPRLLGQWTAVHANGEVFVETLTKVGESSGKLHFKVVPLKNKRGITRPA